jgi:predicted methyltransferase
MRTLFTRLAFASLVASASSAALVACGGSDPPPASPPPPSPPPPTPVAQTDTPAEPPKAEPTPEEKKKAEAAKKLQDDRAKWEADKKAEQARWTPEIHAAAKALAEKTYPSAKAGIQAAMAGKHRQPGNADRDKYRHPVETLDAFGLKPNMTVLDISPGGGWYTELLAPTLAAKGKLVVTGSDPNGPSDDRSTFYGQVWKGFVDNAPEIYGKVQSVVVNGKAPKIDGLDGQVDLVLVMRELHGMVQRDTLGAWLAEFNKVLKPNGIIGVEEHRAKAGADPKESSKKGYVPEAYVIQQFEEAGFKLAGKSEVNANAKDTTDWPEGVWTLPPTLELKDKDKDKYLAIGESDRMTLKFVKAPAKKDAKDAKGAGKK